MDAADAGQPSLLQTMVVPARPMLDLLIVMDDSGSMCERQELLVSALQAASPNLADVDLRMAVVSTDMKRPEARGRFLVAPAAPVPAFSCLDSQTGDAHVPNTADCAAALSAVEIENGVLRSPGGTSPERLVAAARCMVILGTSGDSQEKGLEAMRRALSCDGPQGGHFAPCCDRGEFDPTCGAALPFLRPEAGLLVVLVSDEADCSDPASNLAAAARAICRGGANDENQDGLPDVYLTDRATCSDDPATCFQAECGGATGEACYAQFCDVSRADNFNCLIQTQALTPVDDYVRFLRHLKPQGGVAVRVLPIVGPTSRMPDGTPLTYQAGEESDPGPDGSNLGPVIEACCPEGVCTGGIVTCTTTNILAFTGERYRALGDAFCSPSEPGCGEAAVSICADAFEVGGEVAQALGQVQRLFCLARAPGEGERVEVRLNGVGAVGGPLRGRRSPRLRERLGGQPRRPPARCDLSGDRWPMIPG